MDLLLSPFWCLSPFFVDKTSSILQAFNTVAFAEASLTVTHKEKMLLQSPALKRKLDLINILWRNGDIKAVMKVCYAPAAVQPQSRGRAFISGRVFIPLEPPEWSCQHEEG